MAGGFPISDGGQCVAIPGTYRSAEMVHRDQTHGKSIGDINVIEIPHNAQSQTHRASIPYIWILEDSPKEEIGFQPGASCHQQKLFIEV